MTAGTEGYDKFVDEFIDCCREMDFHSVCADFKKFLPIAPASVLDIGAGVGQNAAALSGMGYDVTAIEPMPEFLSAASKFYGKFSIQWIQSGLPFLEGLDSKVKKFDFVLVNAVWHHLNNFERKKSVNRISKLVKVGGCCAISLRNGPAGIGARVFPTNLNTTIEQFQENGFKCIFNVQNQPSFIAHKQDVSWARAVFKKIT